jgi:hypothetical protein
MYPLNFSECGVATRKRLDIGKLSFARLSPLRLAFKKFNRIGEEQLMLE